MDLNSMLSWNEPKPQIGQNVRKIKTRFQPTGWFGGGANAAANQYIRWDFNTNGLWDPKSAYIYIEVDTSTMPAGSIYQLDNSAQSFMGQYISRVNGVELERVQEYDEMAAFLYDMNIGIHERDAKAIEGIGINRHQIQPQITKSYTGTISAVPVGFPATTMQNSFADSSGGGFGAVAVGNGSNTTFLPSLYSVPTSTFKPYIGSKNLENDSFLVLNANSATLRGSGGTNLVLPELLSYIDQFNMNDVEGHEPYFVDQTSTIPYVTNLGWAYKPVNDIGHARPCTQSSVGSGEWWCSASTLKPTIKSGLPCYERSVHGNFCVPLLSTLFGSISSHGKLLPMQIFEGLQFEFLLSPYAFFVGAGAYASNGTTLLSKHVGVAQSAFNTQSVTNIVPRTGWQITKMELVVDIYYLDKQSEDAYLNRVNTEGFNLDIKQWYLGPKIKYANGASLNQTIQINNGFNSLNAILFYSQPADYEIYPWCRKHKKISNNITSMQLRIGNEYFPSLPVVGHAGNIRPDYISSQAKGNYVEFYINTMQTFGKFFNLQDDTLLNPTNFTSNHVGYDPTRYGLGTIANDQDVCFGSSLFFENQHIPRCMFALDLEKMDIAGEVRSGWDTTKYRPFDLLLTNDTTPMTMETGSQYFDGTGITQTVVTNTTFMRPFYLYIWMLYDSRVSWTRGTGWSSEGRV